MFKVKPCKNCRSEWHTAFKCPYEKRKTMKPIGKEGERYIEFRNEIAYPYLVEKFSERCTICHTWDGPFDVDHIKKRGSNAHLKYDLKNLQLLCRPCHDKKDNQV